MLQFAPNIHPFKINRATLKSAIVAAFALVPTLAFATTFAMLICLARAILGRAVIPTCTLGILMTTLCAGILTVLWLATVSSLAFATFTLAVFLTTGPSIRT